MTLTALAKKILSEPTAPFREHFVLSAIEAVLAQNHIPYCYDETGNLVAGVRRLRDLSKAQLLFAAHTDHPGFHVTKVTNSVVHAKWLGGAPFKKMSLAPVVIHSSASSRKPVKAKIARFAFTKYSREGINIELVPNSKTQLAAIRPGDFGHFDFPGYALKDDLIITKAADDLAGCVLALDVALRKYKNVVSLFTRAEEVGFVGCWAFLKSNRLPKHCKIVSLEASRFLPGAEVGKGPVIRIADRNTIFDPELCFGFWQLAEEHKKKKKKFCYQRRHMDGGSCEATAFSLFGYKVIGLSLPLINYHNEHDITRKPAPEKIHVDDLKWGSQICHLWCKEYQNADRFSVLAKKGLEKNYQSFKPHLKS
ncbi:MAG: hypothetical protein COT74_02075 [Bdellovibrionales bacterium CG10_big_fil_rev_8_21_14_0_10_45_34]|nr:MAG: hypothetical protein COT74_02075 [Bdellovibrionales bacterium CG10_big_fil_rev_8_21_14_0_10_45_34]